MPEGMERAIAAKCVSQVAARVGDPAGMEQMNRLAQGYKKFWDPETKMFYGGKGEGQGKDPNDNAYGIFTEGNAWQYSFLVPHDVDGLIGLLGGKAQLEERLDTFFHQLMEAHTKMDISDVETGNMGGMTIGNEPGMHIPFLYNAAGAPWKAQRTLDQLQNLYTTRLDGIPGNDDYGALSSWFVWSALGIYPVDVCSGSFEIGRPLVHHAEIPMGFFGGKRPLVIRTFRNGDWIHDGKDHSGEEHPIGPTDRYVQEAWWNGARLHTTSVQFADLVKGGELKFRMGFDPNPAWPSSP